MSKTLCLSSSLVVSGKLSKLSLNIITMSDPTRPRQDVKTWPPGTSRCWVRTTVWVVSSSSSAPRFTTPKAAASVSCGPSLRPPPAPCSTWKSGCWTWVATCTSWPWTRQKQCCCVLSVSSVLVRFSVLSYVSAEMLRSIDLMCLAPLRPWQLCKRSLMLDKVTVWVGLKPDVVFSGGW